MTSNGFEFKRLKESVNKDLNNSNINFEKFKKVIASNDRKSKTKFLFKF